MTFIVEIINSSSRFRMGLSQRQNRDYRGVGDIHISLAAIFEEINISLVICVRGYTYHGVTHVTVTPAETLKTG